MAPGCLWIPQSFHLKSHGYFSPHCNRSLFPGYPRSGSWRSLSGCQRPVGYGCSRTYFSGNLPVSRWRFWCNRAYCGYRCSGHWRLGIKSPSLAGPRSSPESGFRCSFWLHYSQVQVWTDALDRDCITGIQIHCRKRRTSRCRPLLFQVHRRQHGSGWCNNFLQMGRCQWSGCRTPPPVRRPLTCCCAVLIRTPGGRPHVPLPAGNPDSPGCVPQYRTEFFWKW